MDAVDEFSSVLRAWRDRVRPEEAGLPAGPGRRTPGLRREELAALAGLSVEYLVRLEQGRARNPSPQTLGALARALRLTSDERDHLYRTAGAAVPGSTTLPRHMTPGVQRLLDRLHDVPLAVFTAAWEPIHWNPLWAALSGDASALRGRERNVAWRHFTGMESPIWFDDEHRAEFSADLAADLRGAAGRYPQDAGLAALIADLRTRSPEFDALWAEARVAQHRSSSKVATATPAGPIAIDCDVLMAPDGDLRIVVLTAKPGTVDADRLDLLRVAGLQARV
jgi:transcriptional regulator with XRE-family HTH domain